MAEQLRELLAALAREALLVHADVPVGQQLDELDQPRHDRVQPVRLHLFAREVDEAVEGGEDPLVHDVLRREGALLVGGERGARLVQLRARALHEEAVRVVPRRSDAVDLTVQGKIIESDGEKLVVDISVTDATGNNWFSKRYTSLASKYVYLDKSPTSIDAFHSFYKDLANDMLSYRENLGARGIDVIRQTAEMKFAQSFAADAFSDYLLQDENGLYQLQRLPAENDPMLQRVREIREREYLFIDTLDEFYANYAQQMLPVYDSWRRATYADAIEFKELQAQSRAQIIGGSLAIAAGIGGVYSSENPYVDANGN